MSSSLNIEMRKLESDLEVELHICELLVAKLKESRNRSQMLAERIRLMRESLKVESPSERHNNLPGGVPKVSSNH